MPERKRFFFSIEGFPNSSVHFAVCKKAGDENGIFKFRNYKCPKGSLTWRSPSTVPAQPHPRRAWAAGRTWSSPCAPRARRRSAACRPRSRSCLRAAEDESTPPSPRCQSRRTWSSAFWSRVLFRVDKCFVRALVRPQGWNSGLSTICATSQYTLFDPWWSSEH